MAEPQQEQAPAAGDPPAEQDAKAPAPTPADLPLAEGGKKALEAERQARKKAERELANARKRVEEYEDQNKSEVEKLSAAADKARRDAEAARAELLRLQVASQAGLPADLLEFLPTGGTEEELRDKAERLLAATAAAGKPGRPAPDPAQGAKPDSGPTQLSRADLARMSPNEIESARLEGRLTQVLAGKA